jgi:hypothetical protein
MTARGSHPSESDTAYQLITPRGEEKVTCCLVFMEKFLSISMPSSTATA